MSSKLFMTKLFIVILYSVLAVPSGALFGQLPVYYVDNAGSDNNDGSSPSSPLRTLAKVNSLSLVAGQTVAFRSGGRWNENLKITNSGVSYTSYGTGPQPIISASDAITSVWRQGVGGASQESGGLFASGMETANFSDWSAISNQTSWMGSNAAQINRVPSPAAHGSYAMQIIGNQGVIADNRAGVQRMFSGSGAGATLYYRYYAYIPSGSLRTSSHVIPLALFTNSVSDVWLQFETDGNGKPSSVQVNGLAGFGGANITSGAINFPLDTWNQVELAYKVGDTIYNGGAEVWINNVSVASNFTSNTTKAGSINDVILGNSYYGGGPAAGKSIYYDDFKIDSSFIDPYSVLNVANSIWYAAQASDPRFPSFSGLPGVLVSNVGAVGAPGEWFWDGSYLYVYGTANPGNSVEVPVRNNAATMTSASNVSINNINFRGGLLECVFASGQMSQLTVTNSTFELGYRSGFSTIETAASITSYHISNNVFRYNGALGTNFNVNHQSGNYWGYNQVYNNAQISTTDPEHSFTGGMKWWGGVASGDTTGNADFGQGTIVEYNQVFDNGIVTSVSGQGAGIWPDTVNGFEVRYNTIYNNKGDGIRLENTGHVLAHHNLCAKNAALQYTANIDVTAGSGQNSIGNQVFNNTAQGGYWGIAHSAWQGNGFSYMAYNTFSNNIAVGAEIFGNFYAANAGVNDGIHGVGNVYSHNSFGAEKPSFLQYNGVGISSYAMLDQAYGSPSYSVSGDPMFVDAGNLLFQLKAGSPCLNSGIAIPNYSPAGAINIGIY